MNLSRRRLLLTGGLAGLAVAVIYRRGAGLSPAAVASPEASASAGAFEVTHTDAEWRKLLTPAQYSVLRQQGTELPYTSPLNDEHHEGIFACAGCALDLYSSTTKFDSGTGWPSFWQPLEHAVNEISDNSVGLIRTEIRCRRCDGHLGHVFNDGPAPTGLRYCMNGVALNFKPAAA